MMHGAINISIDRVVFDYIPFAARPCFLLKAVDI